MNDLREKLASLEHNRWSRGERYRETAAGGWHHHGEMNIDRWRRQRETPYADLSEAEKESGRQEADRTLMIVSKAIADAHGQGQADAEAEVERLQKLVRKAYYEGWKDALVSGPDSIPAGWRGSQARTLLGKSEDPHGQ